MSEIKIGLLLKGRVVGTDDGGDGFDVEEEVFVDFGHLGFTGGHSGISLREDTIIVFVQLSIGLLAVALEWNYL